MQHSNGHQQQVSDDDADRRNRFLNPTSQDRERAASQPPRNNSGQGFMSSPNQQHHVPASFGAGGGTSPWSTQRANSGLNPNARPVGKALPTRSSSFSSSPQNSFYSAMRDSRAFASTFEDDESEAMSDTYDERYLPPLMQRGRTYAADLTRSRSQSLATTRPGAIGSPFQQHPGESWNESSLSSNPLNIPGGRYGDIKPPGGSRYNSLSGVSPSQLQRASSSGGPVSIGNNGYSNRQSVDISNMSPFVRDVGQILLDDGSAFRELWAGMHPPRDENGGGGSGTTSRRHSVSVVQPRRGTVVGFNAPGSDAPDEPSRPFQSSGFGRSGLMLSDDDLASDLGLLNISPDGPGPSSSSHPQSQPSSLPIYGGASSRSPPTTDRSSPYQSLNLTVPGSLSTRQQSYGTPSDSGLSSGGSPTRGQFDQDGYAGGQHQQQSLTARFIPGQGIQYLTQQEANIQNRASFNRAPSYANNALSSPISPNGTRPIHQQGFYPQQQRPRLSSDATATPALTDLGRGVPLHSVPASWPLFIVEFKAGRTDLFYLTDLSLDVRVGDLVIVEADRGKDLGKVVNDSITLAEVEEFQKQQQARVGFGDGQPMSPGGAAPPSGGKKEINPKMIYGKAQGQDTQLLATKIQDEVKALQLCQSKVRQKKLPMEVIDAEYQWDRRKLTFYFVAERRIDFRELVRELFRLYKTRIWMASLQGPGGHDQ
ncbi:hypothetical protein PLICRDRAFT_43902 [Plicaturopsis crispa FD-325 SS-3]|nr:hypothetical protein PLICRDRAFT_43902 [Plicaturopsis crispa FD-325 SS-3]